MKLPKEKIERVTALSSEERRYVLTSVMLDVEKKRLLATNGYIAVVIPCEPDEGDVSGLIPATAFKLARRFGIDCIKATGETILLSKVHAEEYCITIEIKRPIGAFPNIDATIPQASGLPTFAVSLDRLSDVISAIVVGPGAAVGIWPGKDLTTGAYVEYRQGHGVIMPVGLTTSDLPTMAKEAANRA